MQLVHQAAQVRNRLAGARKVAVGLLPRQLEKRGTVGSDINRHPVNRRKHRLYGHHVRRARRDTLSAPERPHRVYSLAHSFNATFGSVGYAHLGEAQRQARAHAEDNATGGHFVKRADGHRQHYRVAREGVEGTEGHLDLRHLCGDSRGITDGIALEIRVVYPHRVEATGAGIISPPYYIGNGASRGHSDANGLNKFCHFFVAPAVRSHLKRTRL